MANKGLFLPESYAVPNSSGGFDIYGQNAWHLSQLFRNVGLLILIVLFTTVYPIGIIINGLFNEKINTRIINISYLLGVFTSAYMLIDLYNVWFFGLIITFFFDGWFLPYVFGAYAVYVVVLSLMFVWNLFIGRISEYLIIIVGVITFSLVSAPLKSKAKKDDLWMYKYQTEKSLEEVKRKMGEVEYLSKEWMDLDVKRRHYEKELKE